jgi:hypothetical protein
MSNQNQLHDGIVGRPNKFWSGIFDLLHNKIAILYLFGFLSLILISIYAYKNSDSGESTIFVQEVCFFLALMWLLINSKKILLTLRQVDLSQFKFHPAWLLIFLAMVLRFYSYSIFPPENQTGFEEIQTGEIASNILATRFLPIEFRFTNLTAVLGLVMKNGSEGALSALRSAFHITGLIGFILLILCLRSLKVDWIPILIISFIAATMRFLVIGSGVADELFASIPILTGLMFFMIKSDTGVNKPFWLAAAGIFSGILMYEYTSYRVLVVLFGFWLLIKCIFNSKNIKNYSSSSAFLNLLSFLIPLYLISLPTVVQAIRYPDSSVFFEAFTRHGIERSSIFSQQFIFDLTNQFFGLTGQPAAVSAYYTPVGEPVILPAVGWLFGISFLFSLFFMGRGIPRLLAATVLLTVIGASFLANNLNIGRMAPTIPILLILSGIFLDWLYRNLYKWLEVFRLGREITLFIPTRILAEQNTSSELFNQDLLERKEYALGYYRKITVNLFKISHNATKVLAFLFFVFVISQVTLANLDSLNRMAKDPQVINEYINDDYSVCSFIGANSILSQRIYIYSPDGVDYCTANLADGWYYGNKQPEIQHLSGSLISTSMLIPGDMVIMASRNRALTSEEISQFIKLGTAADSLSSLQFSKNLAGRITAASICFQCVASTEELQ